MNLTPAQPVARSRFDVPLQWQNLAASSVLSLVLTGARPTWC